MRLLLKTIRWRNFLSTGNNWTEIALDQYKTTLIVGKNGSGKSTLLDALSFVLFNKPFRKINKPQLVNTITNKDCVVEIEFLLNNYNFKVVRGIKPAIFEIYKDDELITQAADNRDYQEAFEKYILKINQKTFCQIVVLGSAIFTPFMALPTPQRRAIIEDLLDLEIFTKMNVLLKSKLDECDEGLYDKQNKKTLVEERLKLTKEHQEKMQQSREALKASQMTKMEDIVKEMQTISEFIKTLNIDLDRIEKTLEPFDKLNNTRSELFNIKTALNTRQRRLNKDILFYKDNEVCPTCHQHIDDDFKQNIINEKQKSSKEIDDGMIKLEAKFKSINNKVDELTVVKKEKQALKNELVEKKIRYCNFEQQKDEIEKAINEIETETFEFDFSKLEEMQNELKDVESILIEMQDDRTIMGYAAVLLKDSGIKAKILKTFIPTINTLISKYLAALDFFVDFKLNEEFDETILSRHRDNFTYDSFSQGEKLRLDLSLLFTWRAIARLRSSINCNVLIFDELLDSALDTEGIDDVLRVIGNLTENDNVLIISHREDQISDKFSKVIRFSKHKNFSEIVD